MPFPFKKITLGCIAALSLPLHAETVQLDDQVITARGYASDSFDTPQAISVIKPKTTDQGTAGDLLVGQPGLAVQSDGAWGKNPVLRGMKKESVVVMVDGIRVNSAQPQGALASFLNLGLLDRAEVIKGPNSVMYGSGAMGGVVNLLTPSPKFTKESKLGGRFGVSASSVDKGYSGAVLLEGSNAKQGFVVGLAGSDIGDYKSPNGREENTGYQAASALVKYHHKIADDVVVRANLQRHNDDDVWYPGSARTGGQPGGAGVPPLLGKVTIHSPKQHRELYSLGLDAPLAGGTLTTDVYHQEVFRQIRANSQNLNRDYVRNDVSFKTNGLRSQWSSTLGDSNWFSVGVEGWKMTGNPERYMDNNPPNFNSNTRNDPFRDGEITSVGIFLQDEFAVGDALITAGLRYDQVKGDASVKGVGPQAQTKGLDSTDNNFSWSLGAVQPLTNTVNIYASVGQAYRAADLRERFEDSARGDGYYHVGNPQLDPERSSSLELGLKARDGLQAYQVAAFYTQVDDYIAGRVTGQNHPNGLPIKKTENLDKVEIYGFEGKLELPVSLILVDAGFTWLHGTNKEDNEPLYEMPANELRLGVGQPSEQGFNWHTGIRAVAKQDRVASNFTNGSEDETSGFVTLDARLGYSFGKAAGLQSSQVNLKLNNLLDKKYHEHLTDGISGQELKAPGRGVVLAFSGSF